MKTEDAIKHLQNRLSLAFEKKVYLSLDDRAAISYLCLEVAKQDIGAEIEATIISLANVFDEDLFSKSEEELEENWFFKWDANASLENNIYNFYDMLGLYGRQCRRWEEKHNGTVCIVERVRDRYLMPKIKQFAKCLR